MLVAALSWSDPFAGLIAGVVACAIAGVICLRRARPDRVARAWGLGAVVLAALAAAGPILQREKPGETLVMVDVSPSTRGAAYRAHLAERVEQLLGNLPRRYIFFSDANYPGPLPPGKLEDIAAEQTRFDPPADAGAILLFSDGQFAPPSWTPRVYAVIDASLENPADTRVAALKFHGEDIAAEIYGARVKAILQWRGTDDIGDMVLPKGASIVTRRATGSSVSARIESDDLWPENNELVARRAEAGASERWWMGGPAPAGFRLWTVGSFPTNTDAYLAASVIVLDDVPLEMLAPPVQERLRQYVQDLGGTLVVLGGEAALKRGGYTGAPIEALLPLAGNPPGPAERWIVLVDASGSMTQREGDGTRWDRAAAALQAILPVIPPADRLLVGSFAAETHWWSQDEPADEVRKMTLPPAGINPTGPTELMGALESALADARGDMPTNILLLTDAEAEPPNALQFVPRMQGQKVRLHTLSLGNGRARAALETISQQTGGTRVEEFDPAKWSAAARQLIQAAAPGRLDRTPATLRARDPLMNGLDHNEIPVWGHAWRRDGAMVLADDGGNWPLAARWQRGLGTVVATAFRPANGIVSTWMGELEAGLNDPRYRFEIDDQPVRQFRLDARDGDTYLNNLAPVVTLAEDGGAHEIALRQIGPGLYAADVPLTRTSAIATLTIDGHLIARLAVPARYAREFDAIGTDRAALTKLALDSGGSIIESADTRRLQIAWPMVDYSLRPWTALASAACLATALIRWRRR